MMNFNFFKPMGKTMKKTEYFVTATEACKLAGCCEGTVTEEKEKTLARLGVFAAGRIKSTRNGKLIYRPFYDPDDIQSKDVVKAKREQKLKKLNDMMEKMERLKDEISSM